MGALDGGPAPPSELGTSQSPIHRGASLTFRYRCGSSLSCRGATGRSGCGSVSSACQGLCVPCFYGHPRACPLKRIHRLGWEPGVGGARSGALGSTHTPDDYHSRPINQMSRMGCKLGRHSPRIPASLELDQLTLFLFISPLDLCQAHPEVQLQGIHVFQGRFHGKHLEGGPAGGADK